jgi:hypothetical protein
MNMQLVLTKKSGETFGKFQPLNTHLDNNILKSLP